MHSKTLLAPLTLRRAEPGDLSGVLTLLADTAEWLHSQGVRQWPRGGFGPERIEPLIAEGTLYVLESGLFDPVASIALDTHADREFWTPADRPADALYVHKLAVSRGWSGSGLGDALLDWAGGCVGDAGLRWLRLDCAKDNARLQDYYRRRGFTHLRTVDLPHRASGALFQRAAARHDDHELFRDLTTSELVSA
ncbi:GNAT family N-acetyltransferase [Nonomuraea soli]|uniref:Ribosomal protein S18 acetylase RimI-like enzyme n=1 Tax=Nonomuraea soli TaxID=1032476 RepID=A0A7W0HMJ8_9ACTN|nr:GNAT family N-acetyltransferase [Nonomuraea soli]MBA2888820.1 ribosomal protein S18 acetylase RimI-like enzyme [Nonomuraea soli]